MVLNFFHEDLEYEPIFQTERGSVYYLDKDSGFWLRRKFNNEILTDEVNLGSLREYKTMTLGDWYDGLENGKIPFFTPRFVVGNIAFGVSSDKIRLSARDLENIGEESFRFRGDLNSNIGFHMGDFISEVFQDITPIPPFDRLG